MQHIRTKKEPKQAIPTFEETVALLMRVRCAQNRAPLGAETVRLLSTPPHSQRTSV